MLTDVVAGLCLIYRKHKILDGRRIIIAEMQAEKQDSNLSLQSGGASTEDTNGNAGQDMIMALGDLTWVIWYALGIYGWPLHLFRRGEKCCFFNLPCGESSRIWSC